MLVGPLRRTSDSSRNPNTARFQFALNSRRSRGRAAGRLRAICPRLLDLSEVGRRERLVEQHDVALRRRLARLDDGLHRFGRVVDGELPPAGATFELRQIAQDLLAHRVHPVLLVLSEFPLEDISSLVEAADHMSSSPRIDRGVV